DHVAVGGFALDDGNGPRVHPGMAPIERSRPARLQNDMTGADGETFSQGYQLSSFLPTLHGVNVRQRAIEIALVEPAFEDRAHAQEQLGFVDGFGQKIVRTCFDRALDIARLVESCNHKDANVPRYRVCP